MELCFWRQNETPIIEADNENEGIKILFEWYEENGINNIGYENYDACYDNEMRYIGKGPVGYYELLSEITSVAKKLQDSGFIKSKFGKPIPIIIHDLEYPWYTVEATKKPIQMEKQMYFLLRLRNLVYRLLGITKLILAFRQLYKIIAY